MQPSSVPITPSLRRSRRRGGYACGVVTVLLITASMQLFATSSPASADHRRRHDVRITVDVLPPIAQPGTEPADPVRGAALVGQFAPASPGSDVVFERAARGGGWRVVGRDVQDRAGAATRSVRRASTG